MKLTRIAFAVAAATLATSAMADITTPNAGPSDLFLAVWNPTTNQSIVQDLGVNLSNFQGTTSYQIDAGSFASDLNASGAVYAVVGGDATAGGFVNQFQGDAFYTTTASSSNLAGLASGNIANGAITLGNWLDNIESANGGTLNPIKGNGALDPLYWNKAAPGGGPNQTVGVSSTFDASKAIGTSVGFYSLDAVAPDSSSTAAHVTTFAGNWNLSSSGLLTWTPVPLPAAVWMLLSGLCGVGALSRRRSAEA